MGGANFQIVGVGKFNFKSHNPKAFIQEKLKNRVIRKITESSYDAPAKSVIL